MTDICEQYPQGDIYGATVADRIRLLPALLGADLGDALDETGGSALASEAVPGALLAAATAPVTVTAAFGIAAERGVRHSAGQSSTPPSRSTPAGRCPWPATMTAHRGGRHASEWVDGMNRNQWTACVGISTEDRCK